MTRITGSSRLESVTVRIADGVSSAAALDGVTTLLTRRHGRHDFSTFSSDALSTLVTQAGESLSLLISAIAFISLLVGGIGVMNIMLVSVTERTHEIGIRIAVGARGSDIRNQFLTEAVLICLLGGVIGIVVALAVGLGVSNSGGHYVMLFSVSSMVIAFASATVTGLVFGIMPARRAARLDPVEALARE
jgi:macrolide transport system ATP-binding/permease protein